MTIKATISAFVPTAANAFGLPKYPATEVSAALNSYVNNIYVAEEVMEETFFKLAVKKT